MKAAPKPCYPSRMRILLTNDDGISSEGLTALTVELGKNHEVWVVAPDAERSGSSHALSLKTHTRVTRESPSRFSCSGTPADCVILALNGIIPFVPDFVISGINRGANLGTDVVYSGTVAAARQAAIMGLPAMAVSLVSEGPHYHFSAASRFVAENLAVLRASWAEGLVLNLNLPNLNDPPAGIEQGSPCTRIYKDSVSSFQAPDGSQFFFFGDCQLSCEAEQGTDAWIVARGLAALSRMEILPRHKEEAWLR